MPKVEKDQNILDITSKKYEEIKDALSKGRVVIVTNRKVREIERTRTKNSFLFTLKFEDGTERTFYLSEFLRVNTMIQ